MRSRPAARATRFGWSPISWTSTASSGSRTRGARRWRRAASTRRPRRSQRRSGSGGAKRSADLAGEDAVYQVAARLEELRLIVARAPARGRAGPRPPRGRAARRPGAGARAPAARAPARAADARALPLRPAGRGARGLPDHPRAPRGGARDRARARATGARAADPAPGRRADRRWSELAAEPGARPQAAGDAEPASAILVAPLDPAALDGLAALGEPLARDPARELLLVGTVSRRRRAGRAQPRARGAPREPRRAGGDGAGRGVHLAGAGRGPGAPRREQAVELALIDAPDDLLEDARVLTLLEQAPCDVAIVAGAARVSARARGPGAGARSAERRTTGPRWSSAPGSRATPGPGCAWPVPTTGPDGRDASRLLANASLAVQRALGVSAEPVLVPPEPDAAHRSGERRGRDRRRPDRAVEAHRTGERPDGAGDTRGRPDRPRPPGHAPGRTRPARQRDALHVDARGRLAARPGRRVAVTAVERER